MLSSDAANRMFFTNGFTLLEVLVAMTILSVGIVGVLGGFSLSISAGNRAMLLNEAVDIAQREFELLSTVPAADMLPSSGILRRIIFLSRLATLGRLPSFKTAFNWERPRPNVNDNGTPPSEEPSKVSTVC